MEHTVTVALLNTLDDAVNDMFVLIELGIYKIDAKLLNFPTSALNDDVVFMVALELLTFTVFLIL